jgi:prepilin-type N-terminal cleavage/methylation domain-containing protein
MLERIREARKNEKGFTLIELLIVIVILGVLAGIVVFAVSAITDKGSTSACKSDITTVTTAEEAYYAQNSSYAATTAALQAAGFLHSAPDTVAIAITAGPPASVDVTGKKGANRDCTGVTV